MTLGSFDPIRIMMIAIVTATPFNLIAGLTTRELFFFLIGGILGGIIFDLMVAGAKWLDRRARRSHTDLT